MRQKNGMLVGIFSLVICVIIVMGVMTPIVSDWTTGERTENEGAGWLRMSYTSSPSYQSIAADLSGEGVVIYNDSDGTPEGTETLSGTEDTIIYADDNLALWYENDTLFLLGQLNGEPVFVQRNDAISLVRESDGIRVSATDTPTITFPFPTYAYEPRSEGNYAFFTNGTPVKTESGRPNAIIGGGFTGVYAYNDIYTYNGLGLYMHPVYNDDGQLYDAYWDKTAPVESQSLNPDVLDPSAINLNPIGIDLNPSVLNAGASLMAVPAPTYTDGDWGYDTMTVSGSTVAKIVSYSGTSGDIVVPSTVGGYSVYQLGKGGSSQTVFDNSAITGSTLTISDGIQVIADNALYYCSGFTGSLIIPDSVTSIGELAFRNCTGFNGTLKLSRSITTIGNYAFQNCSGFTGSLILPDGLTALNASVFRSCSGFTGTVVIPNSVTSIGGEAIAFCTNITGLVIPNSVTSIANYAFNGNSKLAEYVIASDAIPGGASTFSGYGSQSVLDLSDTVDYSVNHYGLAAGATYSDSIGDTIGYISFVELGSDPKLTGPIATLLIAVPLLMVVGLTIAAMTMMRGRVQ